MVFIQGTRFTRGGGTNRKGTAGSFSRRDVYALQYPPHRREVFLISNFRRVLNLVCILLGISPASDCCIFMKLERHGVYGEEYS